jgi:hypothetical protein
MPVVKYILLVQAGPIKDFTMSRQPTIHQDPRSTNRAGRTTHGWSKESFVRGSHWCRGEKEASSLLGYRHPG